MATIEVHDVPEDVHRRLQARAESEGVSLAELALSVLRRSLDRPTPRELRQLAERARTASEAMNRADARDGVLDDLVEFSWAYRSGDSAG